MKTPREILLQRHEESANKLDEVRQRALQAAFSTPPEGRLEYPGLAGFTATVWRELILPARRVWAGLAAVWLILMLVNGINSTGSSHHSMMASAKPSEAMLTFREERQLMAELTGPVGFKDTEPPKKSVPGPRSELQLNTWVI